MKSAEVIIKINGRDFLVKEGDEISIEGAIIEGSIVITQTRNKEVIRESMQ